MLAGAIGFGLVAAAVPGAVTIAPGATVAGDPAGAATDHAGAAGDAAPAAGTVRATMPGAMTATMPGTMTGTMTGAPVAGIAPAAARPAAVADARADPPADPAGGPAPTPSDTAAAAQTVPPGAAPEAAAATGPATRHPKYDPIVPEDPAWRFNRASYAISQPIDRFIFRPAAMVYAHVVPKLLRDGARNFLDNLFMSQVLANDILQLRPKRALHTAVRFLVNTTLGVGGIFDVARHKPFHLPAHPNSLGDTFGYYGIRPGPYLYIPILGPTTLRDLAGSVGDAFTQPLVLNSVTNKEVYRGKHHLHTRETSAYQLTTYGVAAFVVGGLDKRARADAELRAFKADSVDPYAALRSAFLQDRAGEIAALKAPGNGVPGANPDATIPAFDDPLDDPAAGAPAPAAPAPAPAPTPAPAPSVNPAPGAP